MDELLRGLAAYLEEVAEELIFAYDLSPEQADQVRRVIAAPEMAESFFDWIGDALNEGAVSFIDNTLSSLGIQL